MSYEELSIEERKTYISENVNQASHYARNPYGQLLYLDAVVDTINEIEEIEYIYDQWTKKNRIDTSTLPAGCRAMGLLNQ